MVNLTEKAAAEIKAIMTQNGGTYEGVRVFVAGGGCSGLSYGMEICDEPATAEDQTFESLGVKVIVDLASYEHLKGASIDFDDSLGGKGFKINNPNVLNADKTELVLRPGETKDLYFIPRQAGHFKLVCPDHDWAGMIGEITVE